MKKNLYFYTNLLAWGLVLFLIGNYVFGWTTPSANAPSANLPAPINVSSTAQSKVGYLAIGTSTVPTIPLEVIGDGYFSGSVGIGTTAPKNKLDVEGGGVIGATYSGANTAPSNGLLVEGNVGIGTTGPDTKLEVSGGAKFGSTSASPTYNDHVVILSDSSTAWEGGFLLTNVDAGTAGNSAAKLSAAFSGYSGSTDFRFGVVDQDAPNTFIRTWLYGDGGTGNVGIGTTSPQTKLNVHGAANSTFVDITSPISNGQYEGIRFGYGPTYARKGAIFFERTGSYTRGKLHFANDSTADESAADLSDVRMTIDSSGNVGIGTTGPSYKLDVSGTGRFTDDVKLSGGTTQLSGYEADVVGTKDAHILTGPANRGISIDLLNNDAGDSFFVRSDADNGGVPDTVRFVVQAGGNVGIGTASPGYKLDVSGTGRFTGNLTGVGFFYSSDESLKKNVQEIETPLAKIMKLDGISFNWKESGKKSIGLIAQDVEKVFPEIVNTEDGTGLKSIEYAKLVAPLIEAVKEQQKMIDEQRELIDKQGEEIKKLKALFEQS